MSIEQNRLEFLKNFLPNEEGYDASYEFLHLYGNAGHAILYSTLFIPDIEEVSGSIILTSAISDQPTRRHFETLRKEATRAEDLQRLEASFNFIELSYQFAERSLSSDADDDFLAKMVAECWSGLLKVRYPDRSFVVRIRSPEETGSVTGIHFFEKRTGDQE